MKSPPKLPQFMLPSNSGATPRGTWGRLTRMLTPLVGPVRTATALEQKDEKNAAYLIYDGPTSGKKETVWYTLLIMTSEGT